jgi:hypoxanthine-DNA glycosylase
MSLMSSIQGFAPVADARARILILGSMPGEVSLRAGQYYANERNAFWRIIGDLIGVRPTLTYAQRLEKLQAAGIALWDVIATCERYGSLDSDIVSGSVCVNDFPGFFAAHPGIESVFFNGGTAEANFRRHVLPGLDGKGLRLVRLPSTSPAHAARSYPEKLAAWSVITKQTPSIDSV